MCRLLLKALAVVVAAAVIVGLVGAPASAEVWLVGPGGAITATSADFQIHAGGSVYACDEAVIEGEVVGGPSSHVGSFTDGDWTGCTGPAGTTCSAAFAGPWQFHADWEQFLGIVHVRITDFELALSGSACTGTVAGVAEGTYDNSTATLTIDLPAAGGSPGVSGAFTFAPATWIYRGWSVAPAGAITATSADFQIHIGGTAISCDEAVIEGEVFHGGSSHVGSVVDGRWTGCSGSFTVACTVTFSGPWDIAGVSRVGALVDVLIYDFALSVDGFLCPGAVAGVAEGTYDNSTSTLEIEGLVNGGSVTVSGAFQVDPAVLIH